MSETHVYIHMGVHAILILKMITKEYGHGITETKMAKNFNQYKTEFIQNYFASNMHKITS